jgi:aryl-phospho-beta-D-glucosidase BglC (GH1 family)
MQVGFVEKATGRAVVIGEWGGKNKGKDKIFEAVFVDWMSKHCLGDAFIWAINPNSDDLGELQQQ